MVSDSIVDDREDWIMEGMNVQLVEFEGKVREGGLDEYQSGSAI